MARDKPKPLTLDQTLEGNQLIDLNNSLDVMLREGQEDQGNWKALYDDGIDYIWNNQLVREKRSEGFDPVQTNHIFPAAMQEISILAQRRPKLITDPLEDGDAPGAELWNKILQWQFDKGLNVPQMLLRCLLDGKSHGHWIVRPYWEAKDEWLPEEKRWRGTVKFRIHRPETIGIDPKCDNPDLRGNAKYVYLLQEREVEDLVAEWPEYEDDIRAAADREGEEPDQIGSHLERMAAASSKTILDGNSQQGESDAGAAKQGIFGRLAGLVSGVIHGKSAFEEGGQEEGRTKTVTVLEIWYEDTTEAEVDEELDLDYEQLKDQGYIDTQPVDGVDQDVVTETGETLTQENMPKPSQKVKRPVFPFGRHVIRVGQEVLNKDVISQVWDYREWPMVIGINGLLPHTFHGLNGVEMPRGLQDWLNQAAASMLSYVKQNAAPFTVVEQGALARDPTLANPEQHLARKPGLIVPVTPGHANGIQEHWPGGVGSTPEVYGLFSSEIKDQTGMQNVGMGREGQPGQTATESVNLQTNSRLRTAMQSIFLDDFTMRFMGQVHELLRRNMDPQDRLRIVGEEGGPLIASMDPTQVDAKFDLKMEVTPTLPFDEQRRQQNAVQMFQMLGMPYLKRLLEAYDEKKIDELLEATAAWQQLQQAIALAEEGGGEPPAGGGGDADPDLQPPDMGNTFQPNKAPEGSSPSPNNA